MTSAPTYIGLLRNTEFRALFAAHLVSIFGDVLTKIAVAVLVFHRTGSPMLTAAAMALGFLPHVMAISLLSSIVDRYPKRRIMVVGDLIRLFCVLVMAVPGTPIGLLLILVFISGSVAPLFRGARVAVLPDIVGSDRYPLARSMLMMETQTAQVVGFGLGGLLLVFVSPSVVLVIDAVTFGLSATFVMAWVRNRPAAMDRLSGRTGAVADTWVGNRQVFGDGRLRRLLVLQWVPIACSTTTTALAVPFAAHLGRGPEMAGIILTAMPAGMVAGELLIARFCKDQTRRRLVPVLVWLACAPLVVVAAEPPVVAILALLFLTGLGTAYTIPVDHAYMKTLPDHLRGRGMTLSGSGLMLAQGLAMGAAGVLAQFATVPLTLAVFGAIGLAGSVFGLRGRTWRKDMSASVGGVQLIVEPEGKAA